MNLKDICGPLRYKDTQTGPDKVLWRLAASEEFIRLIEESHTMRFIYVTDKPTDRQASYFNPQPSIKVKNDIALRRITGTYGGNKSDYTGPVTANTADLVTVKLVLNAIISENAKAATGDIKDFYLKSVLERPEYMRVLRSQLPDDIQERYDLEKYFVYTTKGQHSPTDWVYVEITKGIYGLPQAGLLAQQQLIKLLAEHGYHQTPNTPCLFRHATRDVTFTLVVDDFLIKYQLDEDLEHLFSVLRSTYEITSDLTASKYIGMNISFDRSARTVSLSMPDYVRKALQRFDVEAAKHTTYSPLLYTPPTNGRSVQFAEEADNSPPLNAADTKFIDRRVPLLRPLCGPHNADRAEQARLTAGHAHREGDARCAALPAVRSLLTSRGDCVPRQRHEALRRVRRLIPLRTWLPISRWGLPLPRCRDQWSHRLQQHHHQARGVIRLRG